MDIYPKGKTGTQTFVCLYSQQHHSQQPKGESRPATQGSLTDVCTHKIWYTHTTDYYSTLKRKETLTHAAKWMNLEDMILGEISKNRKGQILHDSSYVQYMQQSDSYRQAVEWWLSQVGGGRYGEFFINGYGDSVWDIKVPEMDGDDSCTTM